MISGRLRVPQVAQASKTFKLKKVTKVIPAGGKLRLKTRLPKKARKASRKALKADKKVRAKLKVVVSDVAGNSVTLRRTISLKL